MGSANKLRITLMDWHGRKQLALCDEDGRVLPNQVEVSVTNGMEESYVTAKFIIDDNAVSFDVPGEMEHK